MTPLGPNIFWQDAALSLKLLVSPSKRGQAVAVLEKLFAKKYGNAISFNAGRVAMMAILKSLELPPEAEVLIQSYTCVAVPDAVLWSGLKPVFVDIQEQTFNMDPQDLKEKITPHSKVVVVQHTFGIPAPIDKIMALAKKHNLFVVEDFAHGWPDKITGDAAFFSFGRDKVISCVFGGMAVTGSMNLAKKIMQFQSSLDEPSILWTIQQLFFNPAMFFIIKTYDFGLGRLLHFILQKLNLLSKAVLNQEKIGQQPKIFPRKMSGSLASLALLQLERLNKFNQKRLEICRLYGWQLKDLPIKHPPQGFPLLRYTILVDQPQKLLAYAKKRGLYLGNWYDSVVAPKDTDLKKIGYRISSCPVAEKVAVKSVNLLTSPNMSSKDIEKIIKVVRNFYVKNH